MMLSSYSSLFTPQHLGDLLDVLQGLLHCGEAPAAARLVFAAFPSSNPLPPNHICPLNLPPPLSQSSPRKRRRRQRRRRKASPASSSNSSQSPSRLIQTSISTAIDGKLTLRQFRDFDITSMSNTINRLAPGNCYMPINSASTPQLSLRRFGPVLHADQVAAMEEEERAIMRRWPTVPGLALVMIPF